MGEVVRESEVVVIGAGFAGLNAARTLHHEGVSVSVLEARDRVGGRSWSVQSEDGRGWIDRGGQWIGPTQWRLQALADAHAIATFPTHTAGEAVEWREGTRHTYSGLIPMSDPQAASEGIAAILDLDIAAMEIPLHDPWNADDAEALDAQTLATWIDTHLDAPPARSMLTTAIKAVFGAEPAELSLLFLLFYLHSGGGLSNLARTTGGAQERRFVGGSQQLAQAMAHQLDDGALRLNAPVTEIQWGDDHVLVTSLPRGGPSQAANPIRVRATRAVVAMPPWCASQLQWTPVLPPLRSGLQMRMPMGAVSKVHARYERPFWRDAGLNGQLVSDAGALRSTFDDSPPDGSVGALVGFIAGDDFRRAARLSEADRHAQILSELVRAFGPEASEPIELHEQVWPAERYTGGGPVAISVPGALSTHTSALRDPVGAVHWAGTETAIEWCGYLEGALSSGVRAANEVLVALGREAVDESADRRGGYRGDA